MLLADSTSYFGAGSLRDFVRGVSAEPLPDDADAIRVAPSGDDAALERLVRPHLRVVVDEAIAHRGEGMSIDTLIQAGVAALLAAARQFDPERDGSFSSFARGSIRDVMRSRLLRS